MDGWYVSSNSGLAFNRARYNTEGLTWVNNEIIVWLFVSSVKLMFKVAGVTDRILFIHLVATIRVDAAFINFDDVTRTIKYPFNTSPTSGIALFIVNGGDEDLQAADLLT